MMRQRLWAFLFPPDSDCWVTILRIGLGLQLTFFAWSVRVDWNDLFRTNGPGLVNRALTEAILSSETAFTPRLGWLPSKRISPQMPHIVQFVTRPRSRKKSNSTSALTRFALPTE